MGGLALDMHSRPTSVGAARVLKDTEPCDVSDYDMCFDRVKNSGLVKLDYPWQYFAPLPLFATGHNLTISRDPGGGWLYGRSWPLLG